MARAGAQLTIHPPRMLGTATIDPEYRDDLARALPTICIVVQPEVEAFVPSSVTREHEVDLHRPISVPVAEASLCPSGRSEAPSQEPVSLGESSCSTLLTECDQGWAGLAGVVVKDQLALVKGLPPQRQFSRGWHGCNCGDRCSSGGRRGGCPKGCGGLCGRGRLLGRSILARRACRCARISEPRLRLVMFCEPWLLARIGVH
mmetsp:Transcript_130287/g.324895  ORF Transcript_130287/g.324895 Transcript_130287/m.324895 type:complete len:203 (+) Transcript_130287:577-1185(+)